MAVTQKELAATLGVSQQAVSFALNGKGALSDKSRERIIRAANELGYRTHAAARAMARGKFESVAILMETVRGRSGTPPVLLEGIIDALEERNLHCMLAKYTDEQLSDPGLSPKLLRELTADGLLVNLNTDVLDRARALFKRHAIPAIWINARLDVDCVRPDDFGAGRLLTQELIDQGCRRIAYYDESHHTPTCHYSRIDRFEGYLAAMREAGQTPHPFLFEARTSHAEMRAAVSAAFRLDPFDAVVVYGGERDEVAGIILPDLGLRAGMDVQVSTFLDAAGRNCFGPSVRVPQYETGIAAVEMLEQKMKKPKEVLPPRVIPFELVDTRRSRPCISGD